MSPRIILVRHGRPTPIRTGWIDVEGLRRWRVAYDAAELAPGEAPPPALRALAEGAQTIATSDLPRAIASAALLAPARSALVTPLLRETELRVPAVGPLRLPLPGWALTIGLRRAYGTLRREPHPPAALERAVAAAEWLAGMAGGDETVLAVTHAAFRQLLARELARREWRLVDRSGRYRLWSAWTFVRGERRRSSSAA